VVVDFSYQDLSAEYEAQAGMGTRLQEVFPTMVTYGLGYDWVLFSLGSGTGSTELLLPLRLEYAHALVDIAGNEIDSSTFGPALGLGFRWLPSRNFSLEGSVLYHAFFGDSQVPMPAPATATYSSSNQYQSSLSQDGIEARLRLGWRAF
jgi:hypothetical protein